jgi:glycosyltransferase involved in cell wall biosynthesis
MIESNVTLSIVMPCLNEAKTLAGCIKKAQTYLERQSFPGEIIIADNGSTDGSGEIASFHRDAVHHVHAQPMSAFGGKANIGAEKLTG